MLAVYLTCFMLYRLTETRESGDEISSNDYRYHLTEEEKLMKLHDEFGNEYMLKDYFPENPGARFGPLKMLKLHAHPDQLIPVTYEGLDWSHLLKCQTSGRGLKELGQCVFDDIDINQDDAIDLYEIQKAREKLSWIESTIGYIAAESSETIIAHCTKTHYSLSHHEAHRKITLINLLESQKRCRLAPLPLPMFGKSALLKRCDRNNDGQLTVQHDYIETDEPCENFPFYLVQSVPDSCLCRCNAIEIAFNKICDRY